MVVPLTYSSYTSRRVLTTEWLDGEKLSQSKVRCLNSGCVYVHSCVCCLCRGGGVLTTEWLDGES